MIQRADGIPLRVAGCILPADGPANLYFVGLCAPRGPQLPVYSDQMEVILDMIDVQQRLDVPVVDTFTRQTPEQRIDIVRSVWNDDMKATRRTLAGARSTHSTTNHPPACNGGGNTSGVGS